MAERPTSPGLDGRARTLTDLDADVLAHCAKLLGVRDVANLAMTCKPVRRVAYSDFIWSRLFTSAKRSYLINLIILYLGLNPAKVQIVNLQKVLFAAYETLKGHGSRITCMRLFPIVDTSLFRVRCKMRKNVIVTSSSDRTIRLWWKGRSQRCFKGHNGPVTTLADKLLGEGVVEVLASGGEDCTVRLWSVSCSGKHNPLTLTYYGHEKAFVFLEVVWHKASLLVSISKDSRVRVWDTSASSSSSSSACVGMTCVSGPPVAMKCHGALCYIAAGSLVTAIDLRTMRKAFTAAIHAPKLYSFEMLPAKWLLCTGGEDRAMLWDIRKSQEYPEPMADLDSNSSRVTLLHMDPYKVVSGGPFDYRVNVWETNTGFLANSLDCRVPDETENVVGPTAMAVDGCRIVTGGCADEPGAMYYRDFSKCSIPVSLGGCSSASKFWEQGDSSCL
ncbi:LOW QUALITY PROTEIN: uncharacterized WD repeat-containing protein alr2800-like [Phoenix dactylifera]|uniref:LOW QUALITY PROTEIN: uncharacterized WD repeat-containing protein alr2800-like n=1 Tax=Phoenix dactylifera TaxID=42345 RepID=A0A8B9AQE4_PHODC|nr:LOW QUALITY PROTEIN: uncharacterized WD repeat-containing protein alr2800-like [Phoenix dactylifera]